MPGGRRIETIVLASRNAGKIRELQRLPALAGLRVLGLDAFPGLGEIAEDGASFEENALIKARVVANHTGCVAVADDSGLEVDALGGRPGIYSARFAASFGLPGGDEANIQKLLELLRDVSARGARFVCAAAAAHPSGETVVFRGEWQGSIARRRAGSGGFGYDPVFVPAGSERTAAEMEADEKNAVSHRARAFALLGRQLPEFLRRFAGARG